MAENSKIEWTDATWNPTRGCTRVSQGCVNCYAEVMAARFSEPGLWGHGFAEMKGGDHRWTGKVELVESQLTLPLRWKKPRRIFVNSTSDLFHEKLPDEAIDRVFAVMALCPQHTFQVLTKRPERMREYLAALSEGAERDRANELVTKWQVRLCEANPPGTLTITKNDVERSLGRCQKFTHDQPTPAWPLPNVWLMTSVENQPTADERIPHLLATPAAVRGVSYEPALGPVDFTNVSGPLFVVNALSGDYWNSWEGGEEPAGKHKHLDWIIMGGESGKGARPMHPDWARSVRDQCAAAGVAFFFKQWGEWGPDDGPRKDGRDPIMGGRARCAVIGKMRRLGVGQGIPIRSSAPRIKREKRTLLDHNVAAKRESRKKDPGPPEPIPVPLGEPPSKHLGIHDLTAHMCRYIAEPEPPFTYCANTKKTGSSYCEFHDRLCHQVVSVSEANRRATRYADGR